MNYGYSKTVDLTYAEALEKIEAELKERGFGVLTEIDVKATMKKKLDKDMNNYKILGRAIRLLLIRRWSRNGKSACCCHVM